MFLRRVSSTVKGLTEEMVSSYSSDSEMDRFAMLAATLEQIIPTMSEYEIKYVLAQLDKEFIRERCRPDWQQKIAADLIVLLRRRG